VLAAPPPRVAIGRVESFDEGDVVAVVHGTFEAPEFRGADRSLVRDPVTGRPVRTATKPIEFVLALPADALIGPVPVVIYQHGNPGSAEAEVVAQARRYLAAEGFAVIGFTDTLNREVSPEGASDEERAYQQVIDLLIRLIARHKVPDYFIQTNAEQIAFLRAIEEIASIERLDTGDPDTLTLAHTFGIDPTQPLFYLGVSEGANHAPALLAVAPEIRAAVLVAGGRRFSEVLIHQGEQSFLEPLSFLGFRQLGPSDVWVLLSLVQTLFDPQDPHNYAPFIYRHPIEVRGTTRKASILLVEGLDDSLVPNHATEALARTLGPVVHLEPVAREVLGLVPAPGPVAGNVDARTTAALFQFVPEGIAGLQPSAGCHSPPLPRHSAREGHRCVQSAEGSLRQRAAFFTSALYDDVPTIDVPPSDTRSP
jgi:hypothetical protein